MHRRIVVQSKALGQITPYTLMTCQTSRFIHHSVLLPSPKFSLDQYHRTKTLLQDSHSARRNLRHLTSIENPNRLHKLLLTRCHAYRLLPRNMHHLANLRTVQRYHQTLMTWRLRRTKPSWRPSVLQSHPTPFPSHFPTCSSQHPLSVSASLPSLELPPYPRPLLLPIQQCMHQRYRQMKPWLDQSLTGRDALVHVHLHLRSPRRSTKADLRSNFIPTNICQIWTQVPHRTQWIPF